MCTSQIFLQQKAPTAATAIVAANCAVKYEVSPLSSFPSPSYYIKNNSLSGLAQ